MSELLIKARNLFNTAHRHEPDCTELLSVTRDRQEVILSAYFAAGTMVSSKYIINPFKKMPTFSQGKEQLEKLIALNPGEAELNYLRYTIQLNIPKFIGYYRNIEDDRLLLAEIIRKKEQTDLIAHMMVFIEDTKDELLTMI